MSSTPPLVYNMAQCLLSTLLLLCVVYFLLFEYFVVCVSFAFCVVYQSLFQYFVLLVKKDAEREKTGLKSPTYYNVCRNSAKMS